MRLSPHFTLEELISSEQAKRANIDNSPTAAIIHNLVILVEYLEDIRSLLKRPMLITSGYRCPALNKEVGGSPDSAHMRGLAADFVCPAYGDPAKIVQAIAASKITFDQCINERTWVHVGFDTPMRRQVLTAYFSFGKIKYRKAYEG